jgi:hypothetical protein
MEIEEIEGIERKRLRRLRGLMEIDRSLRLCGFA